MSIESKINYLRGVFWKRESKLTRGLRSLHDPAIEPVKDIWRFNIRTGYHSNSYIGQLPGRPDVKVYTSGRDAKIRLVRVLETLERIWKRS